MHNLILKRFQPIRRARREVAGVTFCARTFQKPAHYFCYCPTGLSRGTGWEAPLRGVFCCMCNIGTSVRLCFGVSCDICACAIVLTSRLAIVSVVSAAPGRGYGVPGRGRRAWLRRPWPSCLAVVPGRRAWVPSLTSLCGLCMCRRRVVATRRRMLVFAMVLAWSM